MRSLIIAAAVFAVGIASTAVADISQSVIPPKDGPRGGAPGFDPSYTGLNPSATDKDLFDQLGNQPDGQFNAVRDHFRVQWTLDGNSKNPFVSRPGWDRPDFVLTGDQSGPVNWPSTPERVVIPVPGSIILGAIALGSLMGVRRKA